MRAFKKGPDYIDAAWLTWASGSPARNLDTYLMGFSAAVASFARNAVSDGLNVVEGNRGVFDGMDVAGTHSSAALAKALASAGAARSERHQSDADGRGLHSGCAETRP